jgi:4-diphosphocytidyl-2-C-methyl-D-erythritol kinase
MLLFPNAKVNLGLSVTEKRPDGFHNLQTVFYPVGLSDVLEFVPDPEAAPGTMSLLLTGLSVEGDPGDNLCHKAYQLLCRDFDLPGISVHLHKAIPTGAGLGGGSSDAAYMLKGLSEYFGLNIDTPGLEEYASMLGSDCAFFIRNEPVYATGRGNLFKKIDLDLNHYYIFLIHPGIHIATAAAYAQVIPGVPEITPEAIVRKPVTEWKSILKNDFESGVFRNYPQIKAIKEKHYEQGAVYASMSGSGSSVYGIYKERPVVPDSFSAYFVWCGLLNPLS